MTKRCSACKNDLPLTAFSLAKSRKDGRQHRCKKCCMAWWREWQLSKNPNYKPQRNRRPRQPQISEATKTERHRFRQYGVTPCDYARLRIEQMDLCRICGKPESTKALSVDHDHSTGRVRGLLCGRCNTAIGLLGDDAATIDCAAAYLRAAA